MTIQQFKDHEVCQKHVNLLTRQDIIDLYDYYLLDVKKISNIDNSIDPVDAFVFILEMPGSQKPILLDYVYDSKAYLNMREVIEDNTELIKRALMFKVATLSLAEMLEQKRDLVNLGKNTISDLVSSDTYDI